MPLSDQLALLADRLRDLSAMGLLYCQNPYDLASYAKVQEISAELLALASGATPAELEALRPVLFNRPAPIPTVDAAIFNPAGEILLVRRSDNRLWAMPGGVTEVGETPAQAAAREALEETGVACAVERLVGVFDSRLCGAHTSHHLYMFVFLCHELHPGQAPQIPSTPQEVLETGWFSEADLPAEIDPGHVSRIPVAFRAWRGEQGVFFDA